MTAAILAPHPGTRCKSKPPPLHRRAWRQARAFLADPAGRLTVARLRTRRQRRQVEAARDDAYVVRIEAHAVPPMAQAQAAVTATIAAVTDAFNQPPAAVQPDRDVPGMEHLARPDWEFPTGTWPKYMDGVQ